MNGRRSKEIRKAANEAATQTGRQAGAVVGGVLEYARRIELRTEALEGGLDDLKNLVDGEHRLHLLHHNEILTRSFPGRLRWLLTGR